jgi:ribosomal protein L11 methyltransferase
VQDTEFLSLVFSVPLEFEDALQGYFLVNHEPQGFEEAPDGTFLVHILKEEWTPEAEASLGAFIASLGTSDVKLEEIKTYQNKDWNEQWEAGIEPLRISDDLVIAPSWRLAEAAAMGAPHLIKIDPKMSFGTGHHETTRLCLRMIEHLECTGKHVMDLGSGTGILAMYTIMRGATHAVAIDTDEWAFENAKENCERNGFTSETIDLRLGDLASTTKPDEKFDLIIANIHRNVLLVISEQIAAHQSPGGTLVLSGILEYDADEIMTPYLAAGYTFTQREQENEWVCLRFAYNK